MRARVPATLEDDVTRWWQGLGPAERRALRRDAGRPPPGVVARFVEAGDEPDSDGAVDFYEYLVNHELVFADERVFHICSAHPEARAVLAAGYLPAGFRCPRADATCPMRAVLDQAPGCSVRLSLVRGTPS
jgi:hypothetical protein